MAVNTEYLQLIKPSQEDFYNIEDFNNNFDIIDTNIKDIKNSENEITKKLTNHQGEINRLKEISQLGSGKWTPKLYAGNYLIPLPYVLCGYLRHGQIIILNMFFEASLSSIPDANKNDQIYLSGLPYPAYNNIFGESTSQISAVQPILIKHVSAPKNGQILCNAVSSEWRFYYRSNDNADYYRLTKASLSMYNGRPEFSAIITYSTKYF